MGKERRFRLQAEDIELLLDFVEEKIKTALKGKHLNREDAKLQRIYILGERIVRRKTTYYDTYWYDKERMVGDLNDMLQSIKDFRIGTKEAAAKSVPKAG